MRAYGEPHHIYTIGSGGGNIKENLIQLCADCHIAAHAGYVGKNELIEIVAEREGMTSDAIVKANRKAMGYEVEE
ncbi:HNH endonuclease [Veillonella magna]|uniref:HNH endonuclease signature motif containing protein n=1 Tax=Veillonella magna TaxID=464322 RepID=UPI001961ED69|nr:HNH endonuclease signature motif containing protein [Veillonella magna]MBM6823703.1 HNH endonuclease [Veillonella magna]